jgi:hypothetical protein
MTGPLRERRLIALPYVQGALPGDVMLNHLQAAFAIATVSLTSIDWKRTAAALTTAGYGDVKLVTPQSRSAALLESLSVVSCIGVMISRLVGVPIAGRRNDGGTA